MHTDNLDKYGCIMHFCSLTEARLYSSNCEHVNILQMWKYEIKQTLHAKNLTYKVTCTAHPRVLYLQMFRNTPLPSAVS